MLNPKSLQANLAKYAYLNEDSSHTHIHRGGEGRGREGMKMRHKVVNPNTERNE